MNRYLNGKLYKLVNDVDDEIYVGSTCLDLAKRMYAHRHAPCFYKTVKKTPVYQHMERIGKDSIKIILVEMFPCKNKMELEQRERYWIDKLQPSLNKSKPQRTPEEKANYMKNYLKNYRQTEKDKAHRTVECKPQRTPEEKANYMKNYKQTDKYKAWEKAYYQTQKGKAARKREYNNRKLRKQLDQMESIIKRYKSVKPIEIQEFKLC